MSVDYKHFRRLMRNDLTYYITFYDSCVALLHVLDGVYSLGYPSGIAFLRNLSTHFTALELCSLSLMT